MAQKKNREPTEQGSIERARREKRLTLSQVAKAARRTPQAMSILEAKQAEGVLIRPSALRMWLAAIESAAAQLAEEMKEQLPQSFHPENLDYGYLDKIK